MQAKPLIRTAIPKRRYQVGDYSASLLGDIESGDERSFRYILAFVQMGHRDPAFYVCCEASPPRDSANGRYRLRVINEVMSEVVDTADRWGDLDAFAEQALKLGAHALGLRQDQPVRLL